MQIIDNIEAKSQVDLIRSAIDPSDGVITNEDISQTDYTRSDNNEPIQPQLNPNVLNVMKEMVKTMQEQTSSIYDDIPALEDLPETNYAPPTILPPNLQDILTNEPPDRDLDNLVQIKEEVTDILDEVPRIKPEPELVEIPTIEPESDLLDNSDTKIVPYVDPNTSDIDVDSDAETIPYAEPYKDASKKDEIYRRRAKKKALKILAKKRAKKLAVIKKRNKQTNQHSYTNRCNNEI